MLQEALGQQGTPGDVEERDGRRGRVTPEGQALQLVGHHTSCFADDKVAALLGLAPDAIVYEPVGCDSCGQTGFKGRVGVFEAVRIDDTIRRLINEGADEGAIARHAFARAPNLAAAARTLVIEGQTTPEEAVRITRREQVDA